MFDFDGVIVDSERYALELLMRIMKEQYSLSITEADAVHVIGYNTKRTLEYLSGKYGITLDADDYASKYALYGNFYVDYEGMRPIDGAEECLEGLSRAGYRIGLVSSTRSKHILYALDRLDMVRFFDFIVTGDMVGNSKPSPEPYLRGLAFSRCGRKRCFVVEDSPAGIQSARSAGIFAIGFKAASVKLDTHDADIEIGDYRELSAYFGIS